MQTKDPKTLVTYRITLDSFEGFLKDNNYTIAQETAEDIVQGYVNWFNQNHAPRTVWNYYSRIKKYLRHFLKKSFLYNTHHTIRFECPLCLGGRGGHA